MKFVHDLRYDAPLDVVREMVVDLTFRETAGRGTGVVVFDPVEVDGTITTHIERSTDVLPGVIRKFAGESIKVVQTEAWDGDTASFLLEMPGLPLKITGTRTIFTDGGQTVDRLEASADAKVPLIGGKIGGAMAEQVKGARDAERELGLRWLAGERA